MSRRSPAQYVKALKAEGCRITGHPGWAETNRPGLWNPRGVMVHHTGPYATVAGMIDLLRKGRRDLPGPLCHAAGRPSGVIDLVGWNDTNHAGLGSLAVLEAVIRDKPVPLPSRDSEDGNAAFYGIELIHPGDGRTPWPPAQVEAAVRYCAAVCRLHGWTANSVIFHKGWTTRKPDPRGIGSIINFRARVAERLAHEPSWSHPASTPSQVIAPGTKPISPADEYAANALRWFAIAIAGPPAEWINGTPVQREAVALHQQLKAKGVI